MKNSIKYIGLCFVLFLIASCSDEKLEINYKIAANEYTLPKGEPGSLEERIYKIHEKSGTYVLYDFKQHDFDFLWTAKWRKWYQPANLSENKKYVERFVGLLERAIFNKYDAKFLHEKFPYKVLLVDSLSKNNDAPTSSSDLVNMAWNAETIIAVSNVGKKSDDYTDVDWKKLELELDALFTRSYFSTLPVQPDAFKGSRFTKTIIPQKDDPSGEDTKGEYSCWIVGHILGQNSGYKLRPSEDQDYSDFVSFLVTTPAKEMNRRLQKYPNLKLRTLQLVPFLNNIVGLNVIVTQNTNCPEDKLQADYFEKL